MVVTVSVTGGKGGTGKSFVAVNLAVMLAEKRDGLVLADLDAEAPNDHVLLGVRKLENEEPIRIMLPFIDYSKCTRCGVCARVCDTGAIILSKDGLPFVMPRLCSGCRACYYACPFKAVVEGARIIGYTYVTPVDYGFTLVTTVLREGEEHTPPAVIAGKRRATKLARSILLVDTGAGTGNSITAAIRGSRLVVAVTEPTPLGLHDLESILKVVTSLGYPFIVVVNKAGIGPHEKHVELARKYGAEGVVLIPYSREAVEAYVKGKPVVRYAPDSKPAQALYTLYELVASIVGW